MRSKNYGDETAAAKKENFRYTMIAVCCTLVVLAGAVFTVRANPQWIAKWDGRILNINEKEKGIEPDLVRGQSVVKPVPTVDSKSNKENNVVQSKKLTPSAVAMQMPVVGTISKKFSPEAPIYSKTLDQYTIHMGIDIDAKQDSQVCAVAAGTVTKVYTDDKLGLTIQITHGDGLITQYSNLSTDKMVGESDVVKQGDVISGVGNNALFESIEPIHLHFEVWKDGVPMDPEAYLN